MVPDFVIVKDSGDNPIGKCSIEQSVTMIYLGIAEPIQEIGTLHLPLAISVESDRLDLLKEIFEQANREKVFERDHNICAYCHLEFSNDCLSLDHVIPRCRWEDLSCQMKLTFGLNSWHNLVTSCKACNSYKDDNLLSELGWPPLTPKKPLMNLVIDWEKIGTLQEGRKNG